MAEWKLTRLEYFATEAMKQLIHEHHASNRDPNTKYPEEMCPVHIAHHALRVAREMEEMMTTSPAPMITTPPAAAQETAELT
jgi:hypothetical protein